MAELFICEDNNLKVHYKRDEAPVPSDFKMHTHEYYELYYFAGGSGIYRVEGSEYPLKKGDILIMRPGEAHYIDITDSKPYTRLCISFRPELLNKTDPEKKLLLPFENRKIGTLNRYGAEDFPDDGCTALINKILSPAADRRLMTAVYLFPLLYEIYDAFEQRKKSESEHSLDYRIISYINRHLSDNINAAQLCAEFFISESQLRRIFKRATASSIGEYITVKRLVKARQLMLSGIPPTKAYLQCGFGDYSVFYRAYKKRYGASPCRLTDV